MNFDETQARTGTRRLVSVAEAAVYLGLAEKTVYNWTKQGRIPHVRLGRRVMLDLRELDRLIARLSVAAK